jgi:hypothetical protein
MEQEQAILAPVASHLMVQDRSASHYRNPIVNQHLPECRHLCKNDSKISALPTHNFVGDAASFGKIPQNSTSLRTLSGLRRA